MYLKYGSYTHDNNEASVTIDRQSILDSAGRIYRESERWLITGQLHAETQAALTTAIQSLEAAYSLQEQDLVFYLDDATTETAHAMRRASAIEGPRVIQRPSFPIGRGAEYSTFRSYQIQVEAVFAGDSSVGLLEFRETLDFEGGGERWVLLETLNGPPQRQTLAQQTGYRVIQSGNALGNLAYPSIPGPIWAAAEHTDMRRIQRTSPDRKGKGGNITYENFPVSWQYVMEAPTPFSGNPTLWVGR